MHCLHIPTCTDNVVSLQSIMDHLRILVYIPTCIMISLQSITNHLCVNQPYSFPSECAQTLFFNGGHSTCKKFGLARTLLGFSVDSQYWVSQHQVISRKRKFLLS